MATKRDSRLNGINPLSYIGDNATSPPNITTDTRSPTVNNRKNFIVGDIWINRATAPQEIWILASLKSGVATWIQLNSSFTATNFKCDTGTAIPVANIINILGDSIGTTTTAVGNTITIETPDYTDHSLLLGGGVGGGINSLGAAIDGQIPIGSTGADPVLGTITGGTGIDVTNGAGSITVDADATLATSYACDAGSAVPAANTLNVLGGNGLDTSGAGSTVTVNGPTYVSDSGSAVPSGGNININGAGSISTSAAGNSITITGSGAASSSISSFNAKYESISGFVNVVGSTFYYFGADTIMTETFDVGSDFYPGDGAGAPAVFTAPQDGRYLLQTKGWYHTNGTGAYEITTVIETTTDLYYHHDYFTGTVFGSYGVTVVDGMTAGDTAKVKVRITGPASSFSIEGSALYAFSWFSGSLI
jgi:hypothetical protein